MQATIVHLSDLHFKNDAVNKFRLDCLRKDLKRLRADGPIHTVFTGDLVHAGDDNAFDHLFDELIGPLIELGHELFVVPGNHDVQRVIANQPFADRILADRGSGYLFGDHIGIRRDHPEAEFDPLVNYRNLEDLLEPYDQRNYWGYTATRGSVSVLGLNSAWLCCERSAGGSDRGALRVEPSVLETFAKSLPPDTLRIALLHHPLDWLEETTRSAVNDLLIEHTDLVLYGHVHANDVVGQIKGSASCLFFQAPPLRAGWSKGTNGYAIIRGDVAHKRFEVEYRSYSQPRRTFVLGEDFTPNGRLHPRPEDAAFFQASPSRSALLQRYADADAFDYLDWYRSHIRSKSKVTGSFVVPKAHRITAYNEGLTYGPPQAVTQIISNSVRDQFFVAPLDAGSTTSAYLAFKHLSETFSEHGQVAAYFDAGRDKINRATILRGINQTTLLRYSHSETEQLVAEGAIVLVIDGLCLGDVEQFNLFRETVGRYLPKIRLVYFLSTERRGVSPTGAGEPRLSPDEDEIYEFAQLEVDDIRSMIAMRVPDKADAVRESVVSHVVESFRQMDEPIFASTVAVVIDTITQDPEFKPLNKARLIERYVECLLGRFDLEDVREGTFSSSDKINFLGFVARQLLEENRVGMDDARWNEIAADYQIRFLIELPRGLLDEFLEKGLLTMEGGEITFRGDHLFSFFVAQQMKRDADFAASLVQGQGLFRHYREITVYGELEGTNVGDVLNEVFSELGEIEVTLLENYSRAGIDLTDEWRAACAETEADATGESLDEAATRLGSANATAESSDNYDNAELGKIDRRRGVAERQAVREAEARLLVGMRLYGLLLKNALHLEAPEKLRHLSKLFTAAELWVGFMCACRAFIGRHPIVIAGGVRFINYGAASDPERSYRDFKFNAPNTVSGLIAETLRNPQLAIAIRNLIPNLDPMSRLFARDILLEMPSERNREMFLASLKEETDINLVVCALRTLRKKYLGAGRNEDRRIHLERVVEEIAKDPRIAARVDFSKLRKARLVQDLRSNAVSSAS
ncbi:metallophosphoesterase [Aquamicrobium sp. NLF2-7]|uniref:metallophosphoesterase n=1 Tax=Aquamicrobium sp. NLF2-7 TaxID=2918753 RepID=UPI001EFB66BF|nr:metallophosphoesterase [Aquamicrobium sp. NLF2-7]MCG8274095.1 metallophosphoesterase [Aquamicrobium sp. NLF2-7]